MGKGVFFEPSVRIPLTIHVPWLSQRQVAFGSPVSQIDLVPTLLDLLGIEPAAELDGRSRAESLRDPSNWEKEDVVVIWNESEDAAESGRCLVGADGWKLILYHGDEPELYDLNSDPGELKNLGRDPAHSEKIGRMGNKIRAWQERNGDTLALVA
jgi:choline-sulfatase